MFLKLIEIGTLLFFLWLAARWFVKQWRLAGVKATEDQRDVIEKQADVVAKSESKHKNLAKKKKAVKKFKS